MPAGDTTAVHRCVQRLHAADPAARDELLRLTRGRLLAMLRRLMAQYPGLRRWEQSDDVLQNVQVRLLRCLDQVPVESARSFFCLAATNMRRELIDLSRHYYGANGPGRNHATPPADGGGPEVAAAEPEPSLLLEWAELHEAIGRLPADEREVVDLHWYHGLSHAEAADLVGVSVKTVKRRWVAALATLAARLGQPVPM